MGPPRGATSSLDADDTEVSLPRNLSRETLDELAAMEDLPDDLKQAIA